MTFIVQSSSVFTSAITPLVGQYNIYVFVFIVKVWHYLLTPNVFTNLYDLISSVEHKNRIVRNTLF